MFFSPYLNFSITNQVQSQDYLQKFVQSLPAIIESNTELQKMLRIFKRSNSDKEISFRTYSARQRAPSSEQEEIKRQECI